MAITIFIEFVFLADGRSLRQLQEPFLVSVKESLTSLHSFLVFSRFYFFFLDRCHRIGQTRDVHIYRLISERSIEENIVKKANQKRLLGDLAIEGGNFTTAFFKKSTIKDLFDVDQKANETEIITEETTVTNELETSKKATKAFEKAIATVEDNTDLEVSVMFANCEQNANFRR